MKMAHWVAVFSLTLVGFSPMNAVAEGQNGKGLAESLADGSRAEADRKRDAGRKPADVVVFLELQPGMTVVDLIAGSGYYSEVLSLVVGEKGKVYAQNPPRVLQFRDGANDKAMTSRLEGNRLPNVERLDQDLSEITLEPGTVDVAITALNFHDIYNGSGAEAAQDFFARVLSLLKPGGVLGLIDHSGAAGNDNEKLHRIDEGKVLESAKKAGFEIAGSSDLLRNPADDLSRGVFDPAVRGQTDRFLLKLRKPM
ncbi:MAG: SAM-dependent methyltransferase [Myxococcota bacterium]|jgi:predicted methyltransferase|nr:SAM-dependent methyltransferase [Myxococcota bacterium]